MAWQTETNISSRSRGVTADNLEKAIGYLQSALTIWTRQKGFLFLGAALAACSVAFGAAIMRTIVIDEANIFREDSIYRFDTTIDVALVEYFEQHRARQ